MQDPIHTMNSLFDQLGLDSSDKDIEEFIANHKPIAGEILLHEASFWNSSQANVLKQMKDDDADWAEWVDMLDAQLR